MTAHILTLTCADRPGIVHTVCGALLDVGGNITENAQFSEPESGTFCMRTEFTSTEADAEFVRRLVMERLGETRAILTVRSTSYRPRILMLVSKQDHCLFDLLYRWRTGELAIDIPLIVSNHPDCGAIAAMYGIPFLCVPVTQNTRSEQESRLQELITKHTIDLVVLARYMQILSDDLCRFLAGRAINIHHSFLPGFEGAKPYHQAWRRGVKVVGATAHFVTAELDEGPIIEQAVERVNHAHSPAELIALGRDIERMVLFRAVKYWSEGRILLLGERTVVFAN